MKKRLVKLAALVMAMVSAIMPLNVSACDDFQMASMTGQEATNEDIIGTWVDDPESIQPHVYEFWEENGQLMYKYYRIIPGNNYGTKLGKTYTEFGYAKGKASFMSDWGVVDCLVSKKNMIYSSLYYDPIEETLINAIDGKSVYQKVDNFKYRNR